MSILVKGPAAKQFCNPRLQSHYYGQRPIAGQPVQTAAEGPRLQGLVCLPGKAPLFLLADNQPTYLSIHSFQGQAGGAVFSAGVSPLSITPGAQPAYSVVFDDNKPFKVELSHPAIARWNIAAASHWQAAPDGAIWGGLFYGFSFHNYTLSRNYTLLRHNGERWEIPTATIISGAQQQDYFITAKGCGLPFGTKSIGQKGLLASSEAVNMYWVSREFARIRSEIYPERVWQYNSMEDLKISLAFRTGLPSTLGGMPSAGETRPRNRSKCAILRKNWFMRIFAPPWSA